MFSFVTGAVVAGISVYMLKPQRAAVSPRDIAFLNQKTMESSFPALRTSKWHAWQAMEFFEAQKNEAKAADLCSRAITDFLTAVDATIAKGDMEFMREDVERDRKKAFDFLAAHPELKR